MIKNFYADNGYYFVTDPSRTACASLHATRAEVRAAFGNED